MKRIKKLTVALLIAICLMASVGAIAFAAGEPTDEPALSEAPYITLADTDKISDWRDCSKYGIKQMNVVRAPEGLGVIATAHNGADLSQMFYKSDKGFEAIDATKTLDRNKLGVSFWVYMDNLDSAGFIRFEVTSGGKYGTEENVNPDFQANQILLSDPTGGPIDSLVQGWNKIEAKFSNETDFTNISYIRILVQSKSADSRVIGFSNIRLIETDYTDAKIAHVTETREVADADKLTVEDFPEVGDYVLKDAEVTLIDAATSRAWNGVAGTHGGESPDGKGAVIVSAQNADAVPILNYYSPEPVDMKGILQQYATASLWLYVNKDAGVKAGQIELHSKEDGGDANEFHWDLAPVSAQLKAGWNKLELKFPAWYRENFQGAVDFGAIIHSRIYFQAAQADTVVGFTSLTVSEKNYIKSDWVGNADYIKVIEDEFKEVAAPITVADIKADPKEEVVLSSTDNLEDWAYASLDPVVITNDVPDGSMGKSLLASTVENTANGFLYFGSTDGFEPSVNILKKLNRNKLGYSVWLYISDVELFRTVWSRFEITSGAHPDKEANQSVLSNHTDSGNLASEMVTGWNRIEGRLDRAVNARAINYFRLYFDLIPQGQKIEFGLHELKFVETDYSDFNPHVAQTQEIAGGIKIPVVPVPDDDYTLSDEVVKFASAEDSRPWYSDTLGLYNGTTPDGGKAVLAASDGNKIAVSYKGIAADASAAKKIDPRYAYVTFYMYVNNPQALTENGRFAIDSAGMPSDANEYRWNFTSEFIGSLVSGWNKVELKLPYVNGTHYTGKVDFEALSHFRMWNNSDVDYQTELVMAFSDITVSEKDYNPSDWDLSYMRVADISTVAEALTSADVAAEDYEIVPVTLSSTDKIGEWKHEGLGAMAIVSSVPETGAGNSLLAATSSTRNNGYIYLGSESGFPEINAAHGLAVRKLGLSVWIYIGDTEVLGSSFCRFEITSGAHPDKEATQVVISDGKGGGIVNSMVEGWNRLEVRLNADVTNVGAVNYFRLYVDKMPAGKTVVFGLHEMKFTELDYADYNAHIAATQELKGLSPSAVPIPPDDYTLSSEEVKIVDASDDSYWLGETVGVYSGTTVPDGKRAILAASGNNMTVSAVMKNPANVTGKKIDAKYAYAQFWLYVSNPAAMNNKHRESQFELNSKGAIDDNNEFSWAWSAEFRNSLKAGWNKVELKIPYENGVHYKGSVNLDSLNFFRMYNNANYGEILADGEELVVLISDIIIAEKDYDPMDWDESFMRVADYAAVDTPISKAEVKPDDTEKNPVTVSATDNDEEWANDYIGSVAVCPVAPEASSGSSLLFTTNGDSGFVYLGSKNGFTAVDATVAGKQRKIGFTVWFYAGTLDLLKQSYCRFDISSIGTSDGAGAKNVTISDGNGGES